MSFFSFWNFLFYSPPDFAFEYICIFQLGNASLAYRRRLSTKRTQKKKKKKRVNQFLTWNTYLKYYFFNVSWGFSPVFLGFYAIHLIWQFASCVLFAVTSRFYRVLSNISMSFLIFKAYFKAFFNLSYRFDMAVCLKSSICCSLKILPGFIKYLNVWLDFDFYLKFF